MMELLSFKHGDTMCSLLQDLFQYARQEPVVLLDLAGFKVLVKIKIPDFQ